MLLFLDSVDHYAAADVLEKYAASSTTTIASGAGHLASNGHRGADLRLAVTPGDATAIVGLWARIGSDGPAACLAIHVGDGGVGVGLTQLAILVTAAGAITVSRGDPPTLLGASADDVLAADLSYAIGVTATIGNTGAVTITVDGTAVLELAGVDTQATGAAQYTHLGLASSAGAGGTVIDNLYVADGVAGSVDADLGPTQIQAVRALAAAGSYAEWDPSDAGAGDPGLLINDVPNDPDTYLDTETVGARATFPLAPATLTGTIAGLQVTLTAVQDNLAHAHPLNAILVIGGVIYPHATPHVVTTTRTGYRYLWLTNPATGLAWTVAALATVEVGCRLEA